MVKLTDYIVDYLVKCGLRDVFMISGGGAMHLVDSVGKHPDLNYICPHHEQAAAIAAEGYARASGKLGVVVVTSGPGGTNTLTGVIGQWLDSVPVLYLSGQVKQETTIESCREVGLRQLGDQEINIVDIVQPVTKYAAILNDSAGVRWHLEKAIHLAMHGRPGPVWLDIPLDIQGGLIDEKSLVGYKPEKEAKDGTLSGQVSQVIDYLGKSKRPVVIAGHGIRIAGSQKLFLDLLLKMRTPVVSTFNGLDLIPSDHELFVGRIGSLGSRAGNFALQNADLILSLGSRNNIRQVSYNWKSFARKAVKVVVDIDAAELKKPTLKPDLAICADVGDFIHLLDQRLKKQVSPRWKEWLSWCMECRRRYPVVLPEYRETNELVNPYYFAHVLTRCLRETAVVVAGNGTACITLFQAGIVRKGQRMIWNSGCASMGYDLPAAIGACFAGGKKDVVCLAGDGSLQMNIQELQTVFFHKLPIKLFVLNNSGYVSIRQTQDSFFEGRRVACSEESGVSFPDITKVAAAYGLRTEMIDSHKGLKEKLEKILRTPGACVCEVKLLAEYKFMPRLSSERKPDGRIVSKPLEDMFPFLPRDEFRENML